MASPLAIREFRAIISTTFASNHSNAAAAPWPTAPKYEVQSYDDSGLGQDGMPDETLVTRLYERGAPTPGLSKGPLKISMYAGGAPANIDAPPSARWLNAAFGGIKQCMNARNAAVGTGSTTTVVAVSDANSYAVPGQALLVGRKGDAKGCGEVKPIIGVNTTHFILGIPCNAAPAQNDPVVISTTTYLDEDGTQSYVDTLGIGKATADQRQTIGGCVVVKTAKLGMSDRPQLDIEIKTADHQLVAAGDRASLQPATAPVRSTPAFSKGIGMLQLHDYNTATRSLMKYADLTHDPAVDYAEIPGPGGVNGIEGWQKTRPPTGPITEFTLLFDEDMPGLDADFLAGTSKHVVAQFGHVMGQCFAIEHQKAFVDSKPVSKGAGPLSGVGVKLRASDDYNATSAIRSAATRYHQF